MAIKPKKKKSNQKLKFNITLREDTKQKLAALAGIEKRSVSNLIEILADERWEQLADREGVDYAQDCCRDRWFKRVKSGQQG
jgi:hypothetical protein